MATADEPKSLAPTPLRRPLPPPDPNGLPGRLDAALVGLVLLFAFLLASFPPATATSSNSSPRAGWSPRASTPLAPTRSPSPVSERAG